ncbi:MAG: thioredoxin fold domain-containing protein [Candidatus Syntrophoarchaeum sp.]|nr:thioredoxin fold domain-containing protein [Candidatus Syntrophoarchaeum sp.]
MKKLRISFLVIFLLLLFIPATFAGTIEWHTYDEGMKLAASEGGVAMIYFHSDSCYYCRQMESTTLSDPEIIALSGKMICIDANGDRNLLARYYVRSYPTILFVDPDGEEIFRLIGYRDPPTFKTYVEAILEGNPPPTSTESPACGVLIVLGVITGLWIYLRQNR